MKTFIHQKQSQVVIRSLEHQDLEAIEKLCQETTETQNSHQNVATEADIGVGNIMCDENVATEANTGATKIVTKMLRRRLT